MARPKSVSEAQSGAQRALDPRGAVAQCPWVEVRFPGPGAPFGARRVAIANVVGDALRSQNVRHGDQVVLVKRRLLAPGSLVVMPIAAVRFPFGWTRVAGSSNAWSLWKAWREDGWIRLATGAHGECVNAPIDTPILGTVVGVLRHPG